MAKTLVVFGATGQQGGSVVEYVLANESVFSSPMAQPTLSKQFHIRAITRDTSGPAAQALQQRGVDVVRADVDDEGSLKVAMEGAYAVFALTLSVYDEGLYEREWRQGRGIADAAVKAGVEYYIFSTLSHVGKITEGKLRNTGHFDVKADIEAYIRTLPMKSAFFAPGSFMQNFATSMGPHPAGDGTYAISHFVSPDTKLPLIDTVADGGKYVGAILASPDKYEGKVFSAATGLYSYREVVEIMSQVSGKKVVYEQIPQEVWSGFLPPVMSGYMTDMFRWIQDYGYYGPGTEEKVKWTVEQVPGLTSFEAYLKMHPLKLE